MEERKQSFILFGYRFFYVFLLCAGFYLSLRALLPFREMVPLHLFILAVLSAAVSAADSLKGRSYLYGYIALLAVYAVFVLGQKSSSGDPEVSSGRIFLKELLYLMLFVLGLYLFHLLAENFVWVKRVVAFLLLAGLVAAMACGLRLSHLGTVAALLYEAAVLIEWIESGWRKQKQGSGAAYLLLLWPFLVGYFLLAALMPYKDTPYDWALFVNLFSRMRERVIVLTENVIHFGNEDFGISTTGFSDDSGFFGSLGKKDKVVMVIENPYRYAGNVYLTGKTYDRFDGRQWEQSIRDSGGDPYLDTMETLSAVYGYGGEHVEDYLRKRTLKVQYRYFHTKYLFTPLKTFKIEINDSKTEFGQQGGDFLFAQKQGYGTGYQTTYYQFNTANPVFEELIRNAESKSLKPDPDLDAYQERVKKEYTEDIELSPQAEIFLRQAVAGADTDYEKLLCIERALSGFAYNESPGRLPRNVDTKEEFLDYFLVESREGYCSYFASAFVLLARKEGIPARYVQGFFVPLNEKSSVELREDMAHAWPEAWLEGVGWMPFDPTPGSCGQNRYFWEIPNRGESEAVKNTGALWGGEDSGSGIAVKTDGSEEPDPEALLKEAERQRRKEILRLLGYFLFMLISFGGLLLIADAVWEQRRAAKRSGEESFRMEAARNLQILSALGYRRHGSETLSELEARLKVGKSSATGGFIPVCEEVLYGGRAPDKKAVEQMLAVRKSLLEELKEKKGRIYWLSRIGLYLTRVR